MTEPHSKQFLTDERDRWWSPEQVRSIAAHLDVSDVRTAVDVGCGQGHWTRIVAEVLPHATMIGIDREREWVRLAGRGDGIRYQVGDAEQLPFADASIDLVTAQTLLIHVRDPRAVLREFARVLRPGGKLWLVEPNNLASSIAAFADPATDPDRIVAALRLELVCERGKHALGLGFNSLGEQLRSLLDDTWRDLEVRLCDRVATPGPPDADASIVTWPREETARYWLAGGGDAADFDATWNAALSLVRRRAGAGGVLLYSYTGTRA